MSNERQETIADIVADIRAQNQGLPEDGYALSPLAGDLLSIADRIEAAAKRERESGAEAAQVCGEIGEMIGREAARRSDERTAEKSSAVGNAAAMREALLVVKRLFDGRLMWQPDIRKAHEAVDAALAKPPRNCDRPECATTNAAQDVWRKEDGGKTAYYEWLFAEAKGYEK